MSLPLLQVLDLSMNRLVGSLPADVGQGTQLVNLYLNNNALGGPILAGIGNSPSLQQLDLGSNNFENVLPISLYKLTYLNFLNIEGNNGISGLIATGISQMTDLEYLSFSNTTLRGDIPSSIGALTKLVDLRIGNTLVGGDIPTGIAALTGLTSLRLGGSRFRQTIPTFLGALRDLRESKKEDPPVFRSISINILRLISFVFFLFTVFLGLDNNGFTGQIPSQLGLLTKLTSLLLQGNELTGKIPSQLGRLTALSTY